MRGGDQSEGNLVACCIACNRLKAGQPAWAYLAQRPEQRANFLSAASAAAENLAIDAADSVWPRLIRAIEEAADRATRGGRPMSES
jgi:hypothetical protein